MARSYIRIKNAKENKQIWSDQASKMVDFMSGWAGSDEYQVEMTVDTEYEVTFEPTMIPFRDGKADTPGVIVKFRRKKKSEL